jgi:hypothetical protein
MRAQIKMAETIAILVIFFFLVVFGFAFYVRIQGSSFIRQNDENSDLKSIQIAQKASFLPELQCSFKNVQKDNCFDLLKVDSFSVMLNKTEGDVYQHYYDVFGMSEIRIAKLYPADKEYVLYRPNLTGLEAYKMHRVPVSLYDATAKMYYFGLLTVKYYG